MIMDFLQELKTRLLRIVKDPKYVETKDLYNDSLRVIKYVQSIVEDLLKKYSIEYEVEYIMPSLLPTNTLDSPESNKYLVVTIRFTLKNAKFREAKDLIGTNNEIVGPILCVYDNIIDVNLILGYGNVNKQYVLKIGYKN